MGILAIMIHLLPIVFYILIMQDDLEHGVAQLKNRLDKQEVHAFV